MGTTTWTSEQVAELTRLWADGLTTSEIGLRIGKSKNAVIGRAHREGLAGRPSPITGRSYSALPPEERLARLRERWRKRNHVLRERRAAERGKHSPVKVLRFRSPSAMPQNYTLSQTAKCQYIAGEPSADDSCKCGKPAIEGKSWCPEHYSMVYVAYVPKIREAA